MVEETKPSHIQSNEGWADIMQKILKSKKPKRKKTVVLAKAKKLSSIKAAVKSETEDNKATDVKIRKADWLGKGRLKPNPLERNREKHLQKIAVRGVIQLFNVVNQLQKNISTSNMTTFKEEKRVKSIDKNVFLDILTKGSNSSRTQLLRKEDEPLGEETVKEDSNTWNVLKDNFMMGTKWKDWDKTEVDQEEHINA